ncbi:alpha/beta fold hydrolase [Streptomyces sp. NRRL B-1347]|uniref:alpha/beta fold hydrolase n=1 Tax=Streptomyces sp. NRRL B-1347 TaxID=1476877 RepID=UPI000689A520|nr:alpha/beta hydrolase [Streptomyces sp. NRRL B-1347]
MSRRPDPGHLTRLRGPGGNRLSYHDHGGPGPALLALHGHFSDARTFTPLARAQAGHCRVIALDQRGHGHSARTEDYSRRGYVDDAAAVLRHLGLTAAVVLGHSLGGVNAYQLAARCPDLVRALVVEDIGAAPDGDLSFCLDWPHRAPTRAALLRELGASAPYLSGSIREYADGWGPVFRPADMVASQQALNGDHWDDWLGSDCPALLIRGRRSRVLDAAQARAMARRRARVQLVELDTGHAVHEADPVGFAGAVRAFLAGL